MKENASDDPAADDVAGDENEDVSSFLRATRCCDLIPVASSCIYASTDST